MSHSRNMRHRAASETTRAQPTQCRFGHQLGADGLCRQCIATNVTARKKRDAQLERISARYP